MRQRVNGDRLGVMKLTLSALIAVIVSLGLILIFAMMIKWFDWSDGVIAPVNIAIKIISIAVGVLIATKNGDRRMQRGIVVGATYVVFSYICFSALLGEFSLSLENFWDLLLGVIVGGIMGVVSNILRK